MLFQRILPGFLRRAMLPASLLMMASLAAGEITIEFLPPPMEGTISLGVYDKSGKLVRVLHQEADLEEFRIALNGLVTRWDGKNDAGEECPGGQYRIRGYRVGELEIEGIEFHGNDWAADENGPRLKEIRRIVAQPGGTLFLEAQVPGSEELQRFLMTPAAAGPSDESSEAWEAQPWPEGATPQEPAATAWRWVVETPEESDGKGEQGVRQLRLRIADGSREAVIPLVTRRHPKPPVVTISANRLFLLEENEDGQELRGFDLPVPAGEETSTTYPWRSASQLFSRLILRSHTFEQVSGRLKFPDGTPFEAKPTVRITLVDNPLTNKKRPALTLHLATDGHGAYFATDDGLPLARVSETPHLQWAVMGQPAKESGVVIFESDGAAIEEYRATRLSRMMAFDAGLFTLKAPAKKPEPPASAPTPEATPPSPTEPEAAATTPDVAPEEKPSPPAAPEEVGP